MKIKYFTLIEVLIAVVILAMALAVTLSISAQAKADLIRAKDRWTIQHALEQATEFLLLTSLDDLSVPEDLMPIGFRASCQAEVVEDDLPEFADVEEYRGWKLGVYTVSLYDDSGKLIDQQIVHKLLPRDAIF